MGNNRLTIATDASRHAQTRRDSRYGATLQAQGSNELRLAALEVNDYYLRFRRRSGEVSQRGAVLRCVLGEKVDGSDAFGILVPVGLLLGISKYRNACSV